MPNTNYVASNRGFTQFTEAYLYERTQQPDWHQMYHQLQPTTASTGQSGGGGRDQAVEAGQAIDGYLQLILMIMSCLTACGTCTLPVYTHQNNVCGHVGQEEDDLNQTL